MKAEQEMGQEIHAELKRWGFTVPEAECARAAAAHLTDGKEAAAEVLRTLGVPVKVEPEMWNGCKFTRWTVGGKTLFCG